jgi:hypothetical protein
VPKDNGTDARQPFVLESTTNINSTNWQPAVEMPITNNSRLQVTLSLTPQQRYFRLRKP